MSILVNKDTRLLIQGITGKEGQRSLEWVQSYGTVVVAGVTPGKGGQEVLGVPVYENVAAAKAAHPEINATSIYAPPKFVKAAALEAIAAGIPVVHVIAEEVPVRDTVEMLTAAEMAGVRVVGPSSIGVISPGQSKIGSIAGGQSNQVMEGSIAIVSKSGGMCSEIALLLTKSGYGQSTVIGIGGNMLIGTTYADLVDLFEHDEQTKAVIVIGEIGGWYEELLAQKLQTIPNHKPYLAFISGRFAETLPQGMTFGHAGAIVDKNVGTRMSKVTALSQAGAHLIDNPSDIVKILETLGIPRSR